MKDVEILDRMFKINTDDFGMDYLGIQKTASDITKTCMSLNMLESDKNKIFYKTYREALKDDILFPMKQDKSVVDSNCFMCTNKKKTTEKYLCWEHKYPKKYQGAYNFKPTEGDIN